jgi:carbon storage regulator
MLGALIAAAAVWLARWLASRVWQPETLAILCFVGLFTVPIVFLLLMTRLTAARPPRETIAASTRPYRKSRDTREQKTSTTQVTLVWVPFVRGSSRDIVTLRKDQLVAFGPEEEIQVVVIEIRGDKVRLGIEAPKEITVHRQEVYDSFRREQVERRDIETDAV